MPVDASGKPYRVDPDTGQMLPVDSQGQSGQPYQYQTPDLSGPNRTTVGTAAGTASGAGQPPPYVNLSDPVQAAVWQSFQQKGIMPRDQGDFQYWVDNINKTGGFNDPGNKQYWLDRMAQSSGGAGDYGQGSSGSGGGGGGGGASDGSGFSFDPSQVANDPGYKFALGQGLNAIQSSAAAKGTLLGTGTLKDLSNYAAGAAYQGENQLYNQKLGTFQTNFGDLGELAGAGQNAATQQGNFITQAGNAQAAGTVGGANAINQGITGAGNAIGNYFLAKHFGLT